MSRIQSNFSWGLFVESEWFAVDMHNELSNICSKCDFAPTSTFRRMRTKRLRPPGRPLSITEIRLASSAQDADEALAFHVQAYDLDASVTDNVLENMH